MSKLDQESRKRKVASQRLRNIISMTADQDVAEGPILKLNDDCLEEIWQYLPLRDVFQVAQTHPRFRKTARGRYLHEEELERIDREFLAWAPAPILEDFYEEYGRKVASLKFKELGVEELTPVLPYFFTNLKFLVLSEVNLSASTPLMFPTGLEELEVDRCNISEVFLDKWFTQLNPTLRKLRIINHNPGGHAKEKLAIKAISKLTRIESVHLDGMTHMETDVLQRFFLQNKATLVAVAVVNIDKVLVVRLWMEITLLASLKELTLDYKVIQNIPPPVIPNTPLFPVLERLHISFGIYVSLLTIRDDLKCHDSLVSLAISNNDRMGLPMRDVVQFRNLQNLELPNWAFDEYELQTLAPLKQMRSLVLNFCVFEQADLVQLIKQLPQLTQISMMDAEIGDEEAFVTNLESYLVENNRTLKLDMELKCPRISPTPNLKIQCCTYDLCN